MNKKKGIISGTFEFTAVCDDPSDGKVLEVTKGVFKDISYQIVEDYKENWKGGGYWRKECTRQRYVPSDGRTAQQTG